MPERLRPVREGAGMQPGFPLARAPHDALVTAVLAWKDPDLAPADDEQITGHARAVAAERAANIQAEDDYQHQEEEAVTLLGLADGPRPPASCSSTRSAST
ncbi:hypothetical protein ACFQ60_00030 [Streptomyces zhihengii]